MKKSELSQKSFISMRNEEGDSYFSEIPLPREKPEKKLLKSNKCEILSEKFDDSREIYQQKQDWAGILALEKEKLELLRDNFQKEKVIFENSVESQREKPKNSLKEALTKLKSKKKGLIMKVKAWKTLEIMFYSLKNSSNGTTKVIFIYG
jgi:hypothetical protein